MNRTSDVLIIGAGIIGCSLAESLAAEGLSVTVLERGLIGREASWAAAGMLAPQSEMSEPGPYMDFCLESKRLYRDVVERIRDRTGVDPQYRTEGMFYLTLTEEDERTVADRVRWQRRIGLDAQMLGADEIREAEPNATAEFRSSAYFPEDHQLDSRLMTRGYAVAAKQQGALLLEYSPVLGLLTESDRVIGVELPSEKWFADRVVLAGGCWSGLLAGLTRPVPTYPVKGQMLLLETASPLFDHTLHGPDVYLVPRHDGRVVVGATEEHESGFDKSVQAGAVTELLGRAFELVPALRHAKLIDSWAGLRPGTPDRRPVIGPGGLEGLVLATGHFRNGILLAPITARLITAYIASGRLPDRLLPFTLDRFESGRESNLRAPS